LADAADGASGVRGGGELAWKAGGKPPSGIFVTRSSVIGTGGGHAWDDVGERVLEPREDPERRAKIELVDDGGDPAGAASP